MKLTARMVNTKAKEIHNDNVKVGWWDNPNQCIFQKLQLVSTEIAEATEGERKNLMDDKLPHRKMGEVELADAMIRLLDLAGRCDWRYINVTIAKGLTDYLDKYKAAGAASMHLCLNIQLCNLAVYHHQFKNDSGMVDAAYTRLVDMIHDCASYLDYDLWTALDEKLEYNRNRPDHKRENRAKPGGKGF